MSGNDSDFGTCLFDASGRYFESLGQERGAYWFARDLMTALGYEDWHAFRAVIDQAISHNAQARDLAREFQPVRRDLGGETVDDFQLSRYACFATALSADQGKPAVAAAQEFFCAEIRYEFEDYIEWR